MSLRNELALRMTRRLFFAKSVRRAGIGIPALASLLTLDGYAAEARDPMTGGLVGLPDFPPTAKRGICLHLSAAPSQLEHFDHKPQLGRVRGTEVPAMV